MWLFSVLLALFSSVSDSETQLDYLKWCLFWERLNDLAPEITHFWPRSGTVHFSWADGHWPITVLSGYLLMAVQAQKQKGKVAKSVCCMWLPTSVTQEKALPLTWAVDDWVFSSCVSSKTELWIWEETSLICHVLPICWRHQCWSSIGMLKCEHFYNVAGYGSCSW